MRDGVRYAAEMYGLTLAQFGTKGILALQKFQYDLSVIVELSAFKFPYSSNLTKFPRLDFNRIVSVAKIGFLEVGLSFGCKDQVEYRR